MQKSGNCSVSTTYQDSLSSGSDDFIREVVEADAATELGQRVVGIFDVDIDDRLAVFRGRRRPAVEEIDRAVHLVAGRGGAFVVSDPMPAAEVERRASSLSEPPAAPLEQPGLAAAARLVGGVVTGAAAAAAQRLLGRLGRVDEGVVSRFRPIFRLRFPEPQPPKKFPDRFHFLVF